jgi:hypothetical protein
MIGTPAPAPGGLLTNRRRWLGLFGVPDVSARDLAVFRAFLGFAFLCILFYDPIRAVPRVEQRAYSPLADLEWVHALAASATGTSILQAIGCASAVLFALGIRARLSYVVLVTVLLLHATTLLVRRGVHDWDIAIVTLLGWLVVPWGSAPPLWQIVRSGASSASPIVSPAYGFAIWLPGLTLGLAYAAAAYAKLSRNGLDWITSGAVRYHFVEDGRNTPFVLGLWVATHPSVAVTFSFLAVLVEALFIAVVFVTSWRLRAAFALAALGLMAGFYVFQGVYWWPWLIMFAAFLPWNRRRGVPAAQTGGHLTRAHAGVVAALVAAQVYASYRNIEIEPLLSNYPMYSNTYESPEQFDRNMARVRFESNGVDITDRVETAGGSDLLRQVVSGAAEGRRSAEGAAAALAAFRNAYGQRFGPPPETIDVVRVRNPFDWQRGRYLPPVAEPVGSVRLPAGIIDGRPSRSGGASTGDP